MAFTPSPKSPWSDIPKNSLTQEKIPYEVGLARYAELAKGQMLGDDQGLLKLIF